MALSSLSASSARRANAAAIVAILLAGALSTVWAFLVPIFQAPDEPAHFDYAASIYGAHRLIRLSDGSADWIVSPYTKYLLKALDFSDLAMNSSMRAPSGYGTAPYFARLDAGAPSMQRPIEPRGKINYIVPAYPFGFYALEAAWMHVVALFTSSLVTVFFAARILCVLLLMTGLFFNYRTALNLGVPRWVGVALVAGIGLFPMTSFVSSYVQPDNLAYALVSASLFFATRLTAAMREARDFAPVAASLALLAITKYQCFLTVALPVLLLASVRSMQSGASRMRALANVTATIVPAAILLALQRWIVGQSSPAGASNVSAGIVFDPLRGAAALGFPAAVHYVAVTTAGAFVDFFVSGRCAATFWQVFGWADTPIFIVNGTVELWIRAAIGLGTIVVAVAIVLLVARNASRISRAWRRGHRRLAIDALAAEPVFSSYLLFVAFMFTLYVATNNAFGAEGRHWYPFIFPAFLCLVWYAPSVVRTHRRTVSGVLAGALCCYSLVAAAYALADVAQRYYGPPPPVLAVADPLPSELLASSTGVLWVVKSAAYHVADTPVPAFRIGSRLIGSGAALPPAPGSRSAIAATVDGKPMPVIAGEYQFIIAEDTRNLADAYSQFYAPLDTRGLGEGAHVVSAYAATADGRHYHPVGASRIFFLTGDGAHFTRGFLQALRRAPTVPGTLRIAGSCRGFASFATNQKNVDTGAVALFAGTLQESRLDPYRGVWLLVDGGPYQARYDEHARTFVATIPTADLALGTHGVAAYAITDEPGHLVRIASSTAFTIVPGRGASEYLAHPPSACSDPLHQLAGLNT